MSNIKETLHASGTKVKQYFVSYPDDSIPYQIISNCLNSINLSLKPYYSNFSSGVTIEAWNIKRSDIGDIKDYSGLTYHWLKLIQLNNNTFGETDKEKFYNNLLSHELGHWFAEYIGWNNPNHIMRQFWNQIRGFSEEKIITAGELIAEDFRLFFGGNKAKGFKRGEYKQASDVRGLHDFYLFYKKAYDYINKNPNVIWPSLGYSDDDFNYIGLQYYQINPMNFLAWASPAFADRWVYISRFGIYHYNVSEANWVKVE